MEARHFDLVEGVVGSGTWACNPISDQQQQLYKSTIGSILRTVNYAA